MLGHGFIGDGYGLCGRTIGVSEFAAADGRYAERFKEIGGDVVELRQSSAISGSFILAFRENRARECRNQGRSVRDGDGLAAARSFGALYGAPHELLPPASVVMQSAKIEVEHKKV